MQWQVKKQKQPKRAYGQLKEKTKFAWIPKKLFDKWVWLERYYKCWTWDSKQSGQWRLVDSLSVKDKSVRDSKGMPF